MGALSGAAGLRYLEYSTGAGGGGGAPGGAGGKETKRGCIQHQYVGRNACRDECFKMDLTSHGGPRPTCH
eukprot:scaffold74846_cov14-Tisochrysis_lutea.AAC.1